MPASANSTTTIMPAQPTTMRMLSEWCHNHEANAATWSIQAVDPQVVDPIQSRAALGRLCINHAFQVMLYEYWLGTVHMLSHRLWTAIYLNDAILVTFGAAVSPRLVVRTRKRQSHLIIASRLALSTSVAQASLVMHIHTVCDSALVMDPCSDTSYRQKHWCKVLSAIVSHLSARLNHTQRCPYCM